MSGLFSRTRSGQNNLSLFTRTDFIAYCEGGRSLTREQFDMGASNNNSEDIVFWETVINRLYPRKKVHIKSLGSCTNVKLKAREIVSRNISNNIVMLDRDWSEYTQQIINDDRIVYTYAYAWENDLIKPKIIGHTVRAISMCSKRDAIIISREFEYEMKEFCRLSWILLHLQLQSLGCNCGICPTDQNFGGSISLYDKTGKVDRLIIARRLIAIQRRYVFSRRINLRDSLSTRYYPGHALMGFALKFISRKVVSYGRENPKYEQVISQMLSIFESGRVDTLTHVEQSYYQRTLATAFAAATV